MSSVESWCKKFAWFPVKSTTSGKKIWLRKYWQVEVYIDDYGNVPKKSLTWTRVISEQEKLVEQLKFCGR